MRPNNHSRSDAGMRFSLPARALPSCAALPCLRLPLHTARAFSAERSCLRKYARSSARCERGEPRRRFPEKDARTSARCGPARRSGRFRPAEAAAWDWAEPAGPMRRSLPRRAALRDGPPLRPVWAARRVPAAEPGSPTDCRPVRGAVHFLYICSPALISPPRILSVDCVNSGIPP